MLQNPEQPQVEVSARIFADSRRVFYALTIAEYLEAWMCFPGCSKSDRIAVAQTAKEFVIELHPSHLASAGTKILGVHLLREPHEIVFTWAKQREGRLPETTVCIHLDGSNVSTALRLSHMGFLDRKDTIWHEEMWRTSLAKLGRLLC